MENDKYPKAHELMVYLAMQGEKFTVDDYTAGKIILGISGSYGDVIQQREDPFIKEVGENYCITPRGFEFIKTGE